MNGAEPLEFTGANDVRRRGRTLTYFSGCDYFRLARDGRLASAAHAALRQHGLNVAASRVTTGNHAIYQELEAALARFFGTETAMIFSDGYLAPMAVAQSLAGDFSHALLDESAHGALADAAKLMGCPVRKFKHCDAADLARVAARCDRPLVLTDGMFGYDGSVAPLGAYLKRLPASAWILVDDAHGVGVLGRTGRGTLEYAGVGRARIIQCATLSKAFGAYGGVVAGPQALREKILARSRIFMGTTPLPPPMAGAALAAVKILSASGAQRKKLFANTRRLREALRAGGWEIEETPGPIVRLPLLPEKPAETLGKRLLATGIYPPFLKYGNDRQGAFRFVISNRHTIAQLDTVAAVLNGFRATDRDVRRQVHPSGKPCASATAR